MCCGLPNLLPSWDGKVICAEGNDPGYSPLSFNFGTEWRERGAGDFNTCFR